MSQLLLVFQIISAVLVSALILLQAKGTGLGRTFGQTSYPSKRGVEFVVFRSTIILAVVFVIVSIAGQILS